MAKLKHVSHSVDGGKRFKVEASSCGCTLDADGNCTCGPIVSQAVNSGGSLNSNLEAQKPKKEWPTDRYNRLITNAIQDGLIDLDVRNLLRQALNDEGSSFIFLIAFTSEKVVFEEFNEASMMFETFQRSFDIVDNEVVLGDDVEKVNLLTQIVPVTTEDVTTASEGGEDDPTEDGDDKGKENVMTKEEIAAAEEAAAGETPSEEEVLQPSSDEGEGTLEATAESEEGDGGSAEVNTQSAPTLEQYIGQAPPELQQVLNEGVRMHRDRKDKLIKGLSASEKCDFTEGELKAMDVLALEKLTKLAAVPNYAGAGGGMNNNEREDPNAPPRPIEAFPKKKAS